MPWRGFAAESARYGSISTKILDLRLDGDGHTEYHALFCSWQKAGNSLRSETEWVSGDDPLVTPAAWNQFYRENPDAVMSDISDEDEDSGDEDDSEDLQEAGGLGESQPKEEHQKIILAEIILGNIELKLRKTTDDQPHMNVRDTKTYKKWPKNKTEACEAKFKEIKADMMRTRDDMSWEVWLDKGGRSDEGCFGGG